MIESKLYKNANLDSKKSQNLDSIESKILQNIESKFYKPSQKEQVKWKF